MHVKIPFFCVIGNEKVIDVAKTAITLVKEQNWTGLLSLAFEKLEEIKSVVKGCLSIEEDEPVLMGFCTMCKGKICKKVFC